MKMVHAAAALLATLSLSMIGQRPAAAEIHRPWCVGYVATITFSCTFVSFEQCMETARGGGGSACRIPGSCSMENAARPPMPGRPAAEASGADAAAQSASERSRFDAAGFCPDGFPFFAGVRAP